ncbi:MAG: DUF4105 domain-containing protein [Halopseudomonas sp.]|uniref:DUF7844 domain-containing protein n=1 Tax=Halopseudomonas sp. TaxID=2901191 RepID=UPI003001AC16
MLAVPVPAALHLELATQALTPAEASATQGLLDDALAVLPPTLLSRLDETVSVRWAAGLDGQVIGRATASGNVLLNDRWLPALTRREASPDARRQLLATLVHELAHLYDRARYGSLAERRLWWACQQQQSAGPVGLAPRCRGEARRRFTLSDDPRLLDLAGWPERVGARGARESDNQQRDRSPDAYELSSPAEFVAVNLEYFLLDPQYACRRPALFAYFRAHFSWAPDTAGSCSATYPYLNASLESAQPALAQLDPQRVYAVHYLLAEPNQQWASRWGHSMLRLVICAPGRPPGPDCMLDVDEHLVLSFRAFVDDLQLSSWDGLTGEYPSRLFILPLTQVVDEYTKLELRSLSSIPLQLSAAQRGALLQQAAQLHWSYDGNYYFINNNCAVETLKLLRSGTNDERLRDLESITPTGLLSLLQAHDLADASALADRQHAMRRGYFFDSYRDRYQAMFALISTRLQVTPQRVEDWLALPAAQRRPWLRQGDQRTTAALLLLEQAAQRRQLLLVQQELKERYLGSGKAGDQAFEQTEQLLQQLLVDSGFLSRPAQLLKAGYGLPQASEWLELEAAGGEGKRRLREMAASLDEQLLKLLDASRQDEIADGKRNLQLLVARLREQHRAAGGLQLP